MFRLGMEPLGQKQLMLTQQDLELEQVDQDQQIN